MDIIIYGAGFSGKKLMQAVDKYEDIDIIGFMDSVKTGYCEGIPVIGFGDYIKYKNIPVVISVANFMDKCNIYKRLKNIGFQHIYTYLRKDYCKGHDFFKDECVALNDLSENVLFYAEMSIVDFCNLNCKGCNHYSPIFERQYPDINVRIKDIEKISSLYDDVLEFGLIGGEPLLNPEVKEYIIQARRLLPKTEIQMVTNGLLIPQLDHNILKCICDNKITIAISEYVPTRKIIEKIRETLEKNGIDYVIKPAMFKEKFYKTLSLKKDSIYKKKCISQGCINICDGKIAKCPSVLYIEELNKKFNVRFPEKGIYRLEDFADGKELNDVLDKPIPLCEHCIDYQIQWESCGRVKHLEDFVVIE